MHKKWLVIGFLMSSMIFMAGCSALAALQPTVEPTVTSFVSNLGATAGSTVGHDGALYVTAREVGQDGKILRVDLQTGDVTDFASGLPQAQIPLGGAVDVAFIDETAYVLVTVVDDPLLGEGSDPAGIYRMDGPGSFTLIADISAFSTSNVPTNTDIALTTGVQYAMDIFQGDFLVTDGHHNRVLRVTLEGDVSEMMAFDNTVPTGLAVHDNKVLMAEAGPLPHVPADGKIVEFGPNSSTAAEVASGAPLLVGVKYGPDSTLYALSQGEWSGSEAGTPADSNTGSLEMVKSDGTFSTVMDDLDQPSSLEIIEDTAYVVTLTGEILKIENVPTSP
jgi:hypothetical protein